MLHRRSGSEGWRRRPAAGNSARLAIARAKRTSWGRNRHAVAGPNEKKIGTGERVEAKKKSEIKRGEHWRERGKKGGKESCRRPIPTTGRTRST